LKAAWIPSWGPFNVFDINLNDAEHILKLRDKLKARSKDSKIIFVTDKASRLQETQAFAIGATDIIHRPVDARTLLTKLWSEAQSQPRRAHRWPTKSRNFQRSAARALPRVRHAARHLFRGLRRHTSRFDRDPVGRRRRVSARSKRKA
jgi:DNA-binding response OmpR family regulator